jgi:DNA-binding XRE family transcriptional regulator
MRQELVNPQDPPGFRLKVARMRAGRKQWDVAARVGISGTVLSRIESGKVIPSDELLARLWAEIERPVGAAA